MHGMDGMAPRRCCTDMYELPAFLHHVALRSLTVRGRKKAGLAGLASDPGGDETEALRNFVCVVPGSPGNFVQIHGSGWLFARTGKVGEMVGSVILCRLCQESALTDVYVCMPAMLLMIVGIHFRITGLC